MTKKGHLHIWTQIKRRFCVNKKGHSEIWRGKLTAYRHLFCSAGKFFLQKSTVFTY